MPRNSSDGSILPRIVLPDSAVDGRAGEGSGLAAPAIIELKTGPHILVRAVWYVVIGWWLTGFVMGLAWALAITVIGLPIAFYLVNRIPTVLTLRPRNEQYEIITGADGVARYERLETEQSSLAIRLLYFIVIGW